MTSDPRPTPATTQPGAPAQPAEEPSADEPEVSVPVNTTTPPSTNPGLLGGLLGRLL